MLIPKLPGGVPLILGCTCLVLSACLSSGLDSARPALSAELDTSQTAEQAKTQKARKPIWIGEVTDEDPLVSAGNIYYDSPSNPPGIHEYQGLVFCIIELPLVDGHTEKLYYELRALPLEKERLQKHYHLPDNFRLEQRVMESRKDDDFINYRYATVYRLKDIQALQK